MVGSDIAMVNDVITERKMVFDIKRMVIDINITYIIVVNVG